MKLKMEMVYFLQCLIKNILKKYILIYYNICFSIKKTIFSLPLHMQTLAVNKKKLSFKLFVGFLKGVFCLYQSADQIKL